MNSILNKELSRDELLNQHTFMPLDSIFSLPYETSVSASTNCRANGNGYGNNNTSNSNDVFRSQAETLLSCGDAWVEVLRVLLLERFGQAVPEYADATAECVKIVDGIYRSFRFFISSPTLYLTTISGVNPLSTILATIIIDVIYHTSYHTNRRYLPY